MKVASVIGARPQFIKCAPVSRELRKLCKEIIVHTGQHYDDSLSEVFFRDLHIPRPDYHLGVGSGTHGQQTGEMLKKIEEILTAENPRAVLVYGDTNSTLAGALAAAKLHIPVIHVEAGLRSFNRGMPEEINRVLTDHLSGVLFCPTETAVNNLAQEGITKGVHLIGDVMYDALFDNLEAARKTSCILDRLHLQPKAFVLTTVHRAENTDQPHRLKGIMTALVRLAEAGYTVVFPVHPRTKKELHELTIASPSNFMMTDPLSYLDMVFLESTARVILTDSGGVQKEAYWLRVPCLTLRDETEWVETVTTRWNRLTGTDTGTILSAVETIAPGRNKAWPWRKGEASRTAASIIAQSLGQNTQ
jgi:UDP-GlcNAc3NAcA epimerase